MFPVLLTLAASAVVYPVGLTRSRHTRDVLNYYIDVGVLEHVNPLIGTYGTILDSNSGMIPSVAPPFGITR